jgi:hypothetical protein
MNPQIAETNMTLDEFLKGRFEKMDVQVLIGKSEIVVFPEYYSGNVVVGRSNQGSKGRWNKGEYS